MKKTNIHSGAKHVGQTSRWYKKEEKEEFLRTIEVGDLIEFRRPVISHWGVYIGELPDNVANRGLEEQYPVWDLVSRLDIARKREKGVGEIYYQPLEVVIKTSEFRINNSNDFKCVEVFTGQEIIERCSQANLGQYNFLSNNCEHFSLYARNNALQSGQTRIVTYFALCMFACMSWGILLLHYQVSGLTFVLAYGIGLCVIIGISYKVAYLLSPYWALSLVMLPSIAIMLYIAHTRGDIQVVIFIMLICFAFVCGGHLVSHYQSRISTVTELLALLIGLCVIICIIGIVVNTLPPLLSPYIYWILFAVPTVCGAARLYTGYTVVTVRGWYGLWGFSVLLLSCVGFIIVWIILYFK